MPAERLSHPSEGHSRKLRQLSDFEYRVWCTYRWAANDIGVMRDAATPLMDANVVLEDRAPAVRKALDRMVELGLLIRFEHQGDRYVCSPVWQDHQNVRYPSRTHLPLPDGETCGKCSEATQKLFRRFSEKVQNVRRDRDAVDREYSGEVDETNGNLTLDLLRARAGIAIAEAKAPSVLGPRRRHALDEVPDASVDPDACERAERFLANFVRWHAEVRHSRYVSKFDRDWPEALRLVAAYTDREIEAITRLYLAATGGRYEHEPRSPGRLRDAAGEMEKRLKETGQWPTAA